VDVPQRGAEERPGLETMNRKTKPTVAYFCMEYGLSNELPIYAGGLGILAGDYMKSVADLRLPVVGVGLLWHQGYCRQRLDAHGHAESHYLTTPRDALEPVDAQVTVRVCGDKVPCHAFRVRGLGSGELYLLEPKRRRDRWITARLYGGDEIHRLAQEIVLGVGGVRLLDALGVPVDVYHFNEGHAVFAGLELITRQMERGLTFSEALAEVREQVVFTTHTPVIAGNEVHPLSLMKKVGATLGVDKGHLKRLGGSPFSMTVAGLRLARSANAVAALHAETAREMWREVEDGAPILAITNGVHAGTWQDARVRAATVVDKPPAVRHRELWAAHQAMKSELCDLVRERSGVELLPDRLLIGFARRAAAYKRADLIFSDPEAFAALCAHERLQLVFAGKAHPDDRQGNELVARLAAMAARWPRQVVFVEDYDMTLGAALTRGCDVWLNNPRRPMEASGTSGMKAAMNGVLNLSILDGWWPEGCRHGETGWRIGDEAGDGRDPAGHLEQDRRDSADLYRVLGEEVLPCYYDHRERWLEMMEASIAMARWRFSSDRMVEDYYRELYDR
jgi:starch phosphorylase